jgi:hypothetical protein
LQTKKELLASEIERYKLKTGFNYEQLAAHWGVCKTTLYRAASGNWQRPTKKLNFIAEKVNLKLTTNIDPTSCKPFFAVVNEIWDGSDEHAQKLAKLVREVDDLARRYS